MVQDHKNLMVQDHMVLDHKSRPKSHKSDGKMHSKIENEHVLYGISKASQNNQYFYEK